MKLFKLMMDDSGSPEKGTEIATFYTYTAAKLVMDKIYDYAADGPKLAIVEVEEKN